MGRLFVYDENMTDERAKITVAKMAAVSDIVASEKAFIQYSAAGQLTVLAGAVIAVGDAIFQTEETTLSAANLDGASSFAHGKDYYIYLCDNGKDSSNEVYLISENSTFPDGVEWDDKSGPDDVQGGFPGLDRRFCVGKQPHQLAGNQQAYRGPKHHNDTVHAQDDLINLTDPFTLARAVVIADQRAHPLHNALRRHKLWHCR